MPWPRMNDTCARVKPAKPGEPTRIGVVLGNAPNAGYKQVEFEDEHIENIKSSRLTIIGVYTARRSLASRSRPPKTAEQKARPEMINPDLGTELTLPITGMSPAGDPR